MKKIGLKVMAAVAAATIVAGTGTAACAREMWLHINNTGVQRNVCQMWGFDMLPVLDIAGEIGFNVSFDGSAAVLYNDSKSFTFTLGDASVYDGDGNWYGLDVPAQYIQGSFMIPVKFFIDTFGYSYVWDPYMDYLFLNSEDKYNSMISSEEYALAKQYNSREMIETAKGMLGIPANLDVDSIYGAPYFWEGVGKFMTPITFYHNGEYVAGADFDTMTCDNMRSIHMYSEE